MPPPYPVLLFTGQRIIDEAHQITGKVVDRISHATLASLKSDTSLKPAAKIGVDNPHVTGGRIGKLAIREGDALAAQSADLDQSAP
jgi:hypothetical protein